ncbi:RNA polymerase factor sigma-32, partial [Myxococcota bacterium]|nr:RNA polymerase factor sigma-32 [Myxococcota bacterium]
MSDISRYPLLSREEEVELATHYRATGDKAAADRLVASNMRFVIKVANKYRGYGFPLADLVQEGSIGLMMAVRKFDPEKGYRLISYGVWWIRSYINNYIIHSWSLVKVGTTQAQRRLFFKLPPAMARAKDLDRDDVISELADQIGVSKSVVRDMSFRMAARDFSLDATITTDSRTTHLDQLPTGSFSQEDWLGEKEESTILHDELQAAIEKLNDREQFIVNNRLLTEEPKTLGKIGDVFDVSR